MQLQEDKSADSYTITIYVRKKGISEIQFHDSFKLASSFFLFLFSNFG